MAVEQHRPRIINSSSASTLRVLEERMIRDNLLSTKSANLPRWWLLYVRVCACSLQQAAEVRVGALSSACKAACVMVVEFWQTGM